MRITKSQLYGAVTIVLIMVSIYLYRFAFQHFHPSCDIEKMAGEVIVELDGDTSCKGIYFIAPNTTVSGLFEVAGVTAIKRFDRKDLSVVLHTGDKVVIDLKNRPFPHIEISRIDAVKRIALDMPIDINSATAYELTLIPGIGEKTAQAIVELRQKLGKFTNIAELLKIYGVGKKKLAKIEKYLYVGGV